MEARLELTLFCYKPVCFSYVNNDEQKIVSIRTTCFTYENQEGSFQNKVTSSLTSTQRPQRPARLAHNCKLGYSRNMNTAEYSELTLSYFGGFFFGFTCMSIKCTHTPFFPLYSSPHPPRPPPPQCCRVDRRRHPRHARHC